MQGMRQPAVSVIVPVYNRASHVVEAIETLTAQTLDDFEIIVVDDGSTDGSAEAAERVGDRRVRIVRHETNRGIPAARNTGLDAATGRYIAWLDSDDVARPQRLARQVSLLERRPDLALIGSAVGRIARHGRRGTRVPLFDHRAIASALLFRSPFQQSTIMGRAAILQEFPYRAEYPVCEDLDMFIRLTAKHRVANMPDVLVDRRIHPDQIGRLEDQLVRDRKRQLLGQQLIRLGVDFASEDLDRHITLGAPKNQPQTAAMMHWSRDWLARLQRTNARSKRYDPDGLALSCALAWATLCRASMRGRPPLAATRQLMASTLVLGFASGSGWSWLSEALPTLLFGS
jgi:glycosyltransferase involved in cell wall biosynthesis